MALSEEMWEWGGPPEETLRTRRRSNSRDEGDSERGEKRKGGSCRRSSGRILVTGGALFLLVAIQGLSLQYYIVLFSRIHRIAPREAGGGGGGGDRCCVAVCPPWWMKPR